MQRYGLLVTAFVISLACAPATAQDTGWSVGLGLTGGEASPDGAFDIDLEAVTIFGRWQHDGNGWGVMAEIRDGEDDEGFVVGLDFTQLNGYATYTWRRDAVARPFVKFGLSNTDVEFTGGASDDDTALIVGGGVEVGGGRWAFHASIDATEPEIGVDTEVSNLTLGAVFRF